MALWSTLDGQLIVRQLCCTLVGLWHEKSMVLCKLDGPGQEGIWWQLMEVDEVMGSTVDRSAMLLESMSGLLAPTCAEWFFLFRSLSDLFVHFSMALYVHIYPHPLCCFASISELTSVSRCRSLLQHPNFPYAILHGAASFLSFLCVWLCLWSGWGRWTLTLHYSFTAGSLPNPKTGLSSQSLVLWASQVETGCTQDWLTTERPTPSRPCMTLRPSLWSLEPVSSILGFQRRRE